MSTTTTKQIPTAYGDVEIETVECDSCGDEVPKEDASDFLVGDIRQTNHWHHKSAVEFEVSDTTLRRGYLCSYCEDRGPLSTPPWEWRAALTFDRMMIALMLTFCAVLIGATVLGAIL